MAGGGIDQGKGVEEMRITGVVLLTLVLCGCAAGDGPAGRDRSPAPRSAGLDARAAPPGEPGPPTYAPPGGYPDAAARAPLFPPVEGPWSAVGREARESRRLAGRGAAFTTGVESIRGALPLRGAVWARDASPVAAGADTVVFATPWIPVSRLAGELRCGAAVPGARVRARLVGLFRVVGSDLLIQGWLETDAAACEGGEAVRDRVRGLADDLDLYAREAARRGVSVPLRRG
jgi:hypothetical protein